MVKSKKGEGSEFIFELELGVPEARLKGQEAPEQTVEAWETVTDLKARLLMAEDHPLNQLVTTEMLKGRWPSVEIDVAETGRQAITMLENQEYDLVLMDVQMPEMNGHEAARFIRSNMDAPKSEIPILAFTAYATSGEADKCLEAGMNDYVSKPVQAPLLMQKILQLLSNSQHFDPHHIVHGSGIVEQEHINLEFLNSVTEEDDELKVRMLRIMLDETPLELSQLQAMCSEQNWEGVRAVAHKMKSTMQFLGLHDTLEVIKFIELSARERSNLTILPDKVDLVKEVCKQCLEQLEKEIDKIK
jgi:CheY-like chemotaxis protein